MADKAEEDASADQRVFGFETEKGLRIYRVQSRKIKGISGEKTVLYFKHCNQKLSCMKLKELYSKKRNGFSLQKTNL